MAQSRFFPNTSQDFDETSTKPLKVPKQDLKSEVNRMLLKISTYMEPSEINATDGLYLGTAGVAYMYFHLSKIDTFGEQRKEFLGEAVAYLKPALRIAKRYALRKGDEPSLLSGNCGIYAVASVVYRALDDKKQSSYYRNMFYEAADICKEERFLESSSDDFFLGRAGYVCAALWMARETKTPLQLEDLHDICRAMVTSGRSYSLRRKCTSPLMYTYRGVEYLGASHGLSSILLILLAVPGFLTANTVDAEDVRASVDYILGLQDDEGNFPSTTDDISKPTHNQVHWCHGAPGIAYLMVKAYLVWREMKYLTACEKIGELVWKKGLLRKGPGLCHGIAGSGYVFLLLYRLTRLPKYLHRAIVFAKFMESEDFRGYARVPDHPFSLYEGIAGTVCFLADLTAPRFAAFPFSELF